MSTPPEIPLYCNEEQLPDGFVSYCAAQKMSEPTGSPHVRSVAIYIPKLKECPTVSVRIITHAAGALLTVTSLKINLDVGGYTQIAIAAGPLPPPHGGATAAGVHYCNIVAIGKPA